jgi:flagellar protein FliO/FliZ
MLLVKSRESKSLNSYKIKKSLKTGFYALFLSSIWMPVHAQQSNSGFGGSSSVISIFLSLLLVIAIIFALAFIMRRFNVTQSGNGQMKVVASMMAGTKEKIMVIEVGDEQHLLGITAHNINHLATLNTATTKPTNKPGTISALTITIISSMASRIISTNASGLMSDSHAKTGS